MLPNLWAQKAQLERPSIQMDHAQQRLLSQTHKQRNHVWVHKRCPALVFVPHSRKASEGKRKIKSQKRTREQCVDEEEDMEEELSDSEGELVFEDPDTDIEVWFSFAHTHWSTMNLKISGIKFTGQFLCFFLRSIIIGSPKH